jgi:hypothetical protein
VARVTRTTCTILAFKELVGGENLLLLGPTKGLPRWERLLFLGLRRRESDCTKLPVAGMAKGTWGEEADGCGLHIWLRKGERGSARGLAPKTRLRFGASELESRLRSGASELEFRLRFGASGLSGRTGLAGASKMSVPGSSTVWSRSGYGSRSGVRAGELEPCPSAPKRLCMACGWTAGSGFTLGAEIMDLSAPMAVLRSGDFWVGSWGLSALIVLLRCGPVKDSGIKWSGSLQALGSFKSFESFGRWSFTFFGLFESLGSFESCGSFRLLTQSVNQSFVHSG